MVPSHWTTCRIKNTATVNPAKSEVRNMAPDTEVAFIPMEAIGEKGDLDTSRTKPLSEVISGYSYVADGDIMIAKITPCFENGKGAIARNLANGIGFATTEVINIRPNNPNDTAYLHYLLSTDPFRKLAEGAMYGAGGQKRVADSFVAEYHLSLPALSERTKIAAFLDHETAKIDALIDKQQRLIELLKEKRQAVISHAVTKGLNPNAPMKDSGVEWLGEVPEHWEVMRLKHLATNIKAGPFGSAITKDMYVSAGYRVYGQEQVIPEDFSIGDYYISAETFLSLNQYKVTAGDILISCVGTFGKIAIVPHSIEPGIINPRLIRFQCNKHINPSLLAIVLRSAVVFEQFAYLSRGGTMDVINIGTLSEINIVVPPVIEQESLVAHVIATSTRFDALIGKTESAMSLLQERRTALISAAVTGKIDVRDWQAAA
jgi:type I restriction enzyme S subunit